jgi:hypothetical protein
VELLPEPQLTDLSAVGSRLLNFVHTHIYHEVTIGIAISDPGLAIQVLQGQTRR